MIGQVTKSAKIRVKRALRVRKHLRGTGVKPRLCVVKSNNHIEAQLIDDEKGHTLGAVATFSKGFRGTEFGKKNKASARKLGEHIAEIAKGKNIKEVVFDRGPFKYHGILAELANAARAGGLQF
ncbi:MAG: 50S ribosomal protein L18 [Parachlamydiaceae bacterium]|nr:50S ribosomal protein L18 [Parachlamydiaceae bacterium]